MGDRLKSPVSESKPAWAWAGELRGVFRDPAFEPARKAFYYVRVLEIPTPRWTLYDKVRFGVEMSDEVPLVHQERAFTSPIWYAP